MTPTSEGKPLYFDRPGRSQCEACKRQGVQIVYAPGWTYINDPANSPFNDNTAYVICRHHVPEDAVIYNPKTGELRTKDGKKSWREDPTHSGLRVGDRVVVQGFTEDGQAVKEPGTLLEIDQVSALVAFNDGSRHQIKPQNVRRLRREDRMGQA